MIDSKTMPNGMVAPVTRCRVVEFTAEEMDATARGASGIGSTGR